MFEPNSPLRLQAFRALWLASIFSYVGTFIEDVGHGWLMVTLTSNPLLVAALTTAWTVPALLLALPSGLLADRFDRRKLLVWSQSLSALTALGLAIATAAGLVSPGVILTACVGLGLSSALASPSWFTLIADLVPRESTAEAVALNSIAFNLARAVGPALGGLVLGALGPVWAFGINAASFLAVIWALQSYPEFRAAAEAPRERRAQESIVTALLAPFAQVRWSPRLASPFFAIALFSVPASCAISMLPAFAKHSLETTARGFGALLAALGLGAIVGGLVLKRARARLGPRALVGMAFALYGASIFAMAFAPNVLLAFLCLIPAGFGWVTLSVLNATVQLASPSWIKSRTMALYQMSFLVCWSLGAALGGVIARLTNERVSVAVGGAGVLLVSAVIRRLQLPSRDADLVAEPVPTPMPISAA